MSNKSFRTQSALKLALRSALALGAVAVSVPTFAANSATVNASATVVLPIALAKATDLAFGKFAPDTATSTVTVFTDGSRSKTGSAFLLASAPGAASRLNVTGEVSTAYTVTYTPSATVISGGNNMNITFFSTNAPDNTTATGMFTAGNLGLGSAESIYIGATLAVGANQAPGTYAGTIAVSVDYD